VRAPPLQPFSQIFNRGVSGDGIKEEVLIAMGMAATAVDYLQRVHDFLAGEKETDLEVDINDAIKYLRQSLQSVSEIGDKLAA
jgi:hypothetical protein